MGAVTFMKKKTAILVDAEWFRKMLRKALAPLVTAATPSSAPVTPTPAATASTSLPSSAITADLFYRNACLTIEKGEEELFRFFCYDCKPFDKAQRNPIDGVWIRFGHTHPAYKDRMRFFDDLAQLPYVALRCGTVKGRGWEITENCTNTLLKSPTGTVTLNPNDISYGLEQKGVDMRIGMDVAALSIKRLVDRIILISGDTDMIPAIKLARREGVQVAVTQVGSMGRLAPALIEDADILRTITPIL
jgi:uncharacterized LabA/DUF88 family protein